MKTIKKFIFLAALTAVYATPMHGAQYKHYARKAATIGCIYGGFFGAQYLDCSPLIGNSSEQDASIEIKNFVHSIAERNGHLNPKDIEVKIIPSMGGNACASGNKIFRKISIDQDFASRLQCSLENKTPKPYLNKQTKKHLSVSAQENIALMSGTISHELEHIKKEHSLKRGILAITLPLIAFGLHEIPLIRTLFHRNPKKTIAAGFLCYNMLLKKYLRMQEYEADNAVVVPSELAAKIKYYRFYDDNIDNTLEQFEKSFDEPLKESEKNAVQLVWTLDSLFSTHPKHYERADRLESRLQEYEENN